MIQGSILNALISFDDFFVRDIDSLIAEHPMNSYEDNDFEQKTLFWGKSRKFPTLVQFNKSLSTHKQFILQAARIMCKTRGYKISPREVELVYDSSIDSLVERLPKGASSLDLLSAVQGQVHYSRSEHVPFHQRTSEVSGSSLNAMPPPQYYLKAIRDLMATSSLSQQVMLTDIRKQALKIEVEHFLKVDMR